jgi:hypothetical protein
MGIGEAATVFGQLIQHWRLYACCTVGSEIAVSNIVCEDENDVGFFDSRQ